MRGKLEKQRSTNPQMSACAAPSRVMCDTRVSSIAILLQMHVPFSLKTASIHIALVPNEGLHSLQGNNKT